MTEDPQIEALYAEVRRQILEARTQNQKPVVVLLSQFAHWSLDTPSLVWGLTVAVDDRLTGQDQSVWVLCR